MVKNGYTNMMLLIYSHYSIFDLHAVLIGTQDQMVSPNP